MSTAAEVTVQIQGEEVQVNHHKVTGMRYPDGSILWGSDPNANNGGKLEFNNLRVGYGTDSMYWKEALQRRAKQAKVDEDTYIDGHVMVERTIIVSVGPIEDVAK